jgi:hypothetical protein
MVSVAFGAKGNAAAKMGGGETIASLPRRT